MPIALEVCQSIIGDGVRKENEYQIGSYAMTILDQSLTLASTAESCLVTTSVVVPASRSWKR